jgi:hypothetical protein
MSELIPALTRGVRSGDTIPHWHHVLICWKLAARADVAAGMTKLEGASKTEPSILGVLCRLMPGGSNRRMLWTGNQSAATPLFSSERFSVYFGAAK